MKRATPATPAPAAADPQKRPWFVAKRYGWGWTPATWEGWMITALFIALELAIIFSSMELVHGWRDYLLYTILPLAAGIALFILICSRTGERPRWRWG